MISVIIPCYKSNESLLELIKSLKKVFLEMGSTYEILLVNDCSPDNTWDYISRLVEQNQCVKGINLLKNVGQHSAILAGMNYAKGDLVLSCDDDGQTPIERIPEMIKKIEDGYDVVSAKYIEFEKKKLWRRIGTTLYKFCFKLFMDIPKDTEVRAFMVIKRVVVDEILKYDQPYAAINGLVLRTTHNIGNVEMTQHARKTGRSTYTLRKLMRGWTNSFTAFSIVPLRIAAVAGTISAIIGFLGGIFVTVKKILNPTMQAGWSSTIVLMLFMFGLVLCVLGIIGEYLGRIYLCINKTPAYTVKEVKTRSDEQ